MTSADILSRLRRFLLVFSVLLFGGTVVELWLVNHKEETLQLIPFALCALGTAAALFALFRPRRASLWLLRACMALVVCGTLLGVYLHLDGNIDFQREIDPNAPAADMLLSVLGGGNPLLAPGILAVSAVLALAATYYHPALSKGDDDNTERD